MADCENFILAELVQVLLLSLLLLGLIWAVLEARWLWSCSVKVLGKLTAWVKTLKDTTKKQEGKLELEVDDALSKQWAGAGGTELQGPETKEEALAEECAVVPRGGHTSAVLPAMEEVEEVGDDDLKSSRSPFPVGPTDIEPSDAEEEPLCPVLPEEEESPPQQEEAPPDEEKARPEQEEVTPEQEEIRACAVLEEQAPALHSPTACKASLLETDEEMVGKMKPEGPSHPSLGEALGSQEKAEACPAPAQLLAHSSLSSLDMVTSSLQGPAQPSRRVPKPLRRQHRTQQHLSHFRKVLNRLRGAFQHPSSMAGQQE